MMSEVPEVERLRRALGWVMSEVSWQVLTDGSAGWLVAGEGVEECLIPEDVLATLMELEYAENGDDE